MKKGTTQKSVPVLGETPAEWTQLTTLPTEESDGLALYDAQGHLILAEADAEYGPTKVVATGRTLEATPLVSTESVEMGLQDADLDVDADTLSRLVNWYTAMVTDMVRGDVFDPTFETLSWDRYGYAEQMDVSALADEIQDIVLDRTEAEAIAATVSNWRTHVDGEPSEVASCEFAAQLQVTS